jgi:hypothetical protein
LGFMQLSYDSFRCVSFLQSYLRAPRRYLS